MAITRLHGRTSTLAANPRRKRRNPARTAGGRFRRHAGAKRRNPLLSKTRKTIRAKVPKGARAISYLYAAKATRSTRTGRTVKTRQLTGTNQLRTYASGKKHMAVKPTFTVFRSGKGKSAGYGIVKNPKRRKHAFKRNGGPVVAGISIMELGGGALVTLTLNNAIQGFLTKADPTTGKSLADKIPGMDTQFAKDYHIADALADIVVAAAAAYGYKKLNGTAKDVAKWTFAFSTFAALQKTVGKKLEESTSKLFSGDAAAPTATVKDGATKGLYLTAQGQRAGVGGMRGMGGVYIAPNGRMAGDLGLGQIKSVYG